MTGDPNLKRAFSEAVRRYARILREMTNFAVTDSIMGRGSTTVLDGAIVRLRWQQHMQCARWQFT